MGPVAECVRAAPVPLQGGAGLDLPKSHGSQATGQHRRNVRGVSQEDLSAGRASEGWKLRKAREKGPGVSLSSWMVSSVPGIFDRHQ